MKIIVAILIIAVLAGGGYMVKGYMDQSSEAAALKSQIKDDSNSLTVVNLSNQSLATDIAGLKDQETQVQQAINAAATGVPAKMDSNEIINNLLSAGLKFKVSVLPLNTTDWATTKIGQDDYWVFRASMSLKGNQDNMINFLKYLQSSIYPTLVIENLNFTQSAQPTPTGTTSASAGNLISASIGIAIYAK